MKNSSPVRETTVDGTIDACLDGENLIALGIKGDYIKGFKLSEPNLEKFKELDTELIEEKGRKFEFRDSNPNIAARFGEPISLNDAIKYFPNLKSKAYWEKLNLKGYGDSLKFELPKFS